MHAGRRGVARSGGLAAAVIPLTPFSGYAKLAAGGVALVLVVGLCWKSYTAGQADVQAEWNADKVSRSIAQAKAVDQRIEENESLRTKYAADHQREVERHEAETAFNRDLEQRNAGRRVPVDAGLCRQGPAGPTKAAGTAGAQQTTAAAGILPGRTGSDIQEPVRPINLPQRVVDRWRRAAVLADESVAVARTLQNEVKASGCF